MVVRSKARFKADDLWKTPDDGKQYEVIEGRLVEMPPPRWGHQRVLSKLHFVLARHIYEHGLGEIVTAPVGVVLDEDNGLQPDLLFISNARREIISERGVEGAPDLVVEVLSPSTRSRDRGVKMRRYAAAGVGHYWLLDYRKQTLEALRLVDGHYERVGTFGIGDVFRPELFPGLEIALDSLFG